MTPVEMNLRKSFRLVKNDMMRLQAKMTELAQQQERIMEFIAKQSSLEAKMDAKVSKIASVVSDKAKVDRRRSCPPKKTRYVASQTGKKFHIESCPFAKNIKPKSRIFFNSKVKPLNEGLKACNCVKTI